jgi:hypothetical protein
LGGAPAVISVELDLPDGVRVQRTAAGLVATAPGMLLTVTSEPAVADAARSAHEAVEAHLAHLPAAQLIDAAAAPPDGMRILLHHAGEHGATCLEEWRFVRGGRLVTLAFQCATPAYDALADTAAAAAASLR